jgi:YebC/PmpR family DNA-binding regulatory protein
MSGHSKWKTIKHKKGVLDARRGQLFTKLAREIVVATREGGPDPGGNVRLRLAVDKAKQNNMPNENIERAIKKGSGTSDGGAIVEQINYEGYGPGGVAILVEALTDNRNRTAPEIRGVFSKNGGSMGEVGCVVWIFESKSVVTVENATNDLTEADEELELVAIDAGAEDLRRDGGYLEVYSDPMNLYAISLALQGHGARVANAEISMVPKMTISLAKSEAEQTLRLLDRLEDLDDVQRVHTNADFPESVLEKYQSGAIS